jgi:hypothetical protein
MDLIYREGPDENNLVIKNLSTGYSLRMDIVLPTTKTRIYTFNTESLSDVDPGAPVVPDSVIEGTLSAGSSTTPNISILVPRSLTLPPSGAVYTQMIASPSITLFNYDVFLRNTSANRQAKILKGTITVEESYTLWL